MKHVRLINIIRDFPFPRQLPGNFTATHGLSFVWNDDGLDLTGSPSAPWEDYLVCYDELKYAVPTRVPRERRLLVIGEPPCITRYPAQYLNLFGTVICPYDLPRFHGKHVRTHSSLWWFYGLNPKKPTAPVLNWDELAAMPVPDKHALMSTVCGNKSWCMMHKRRRNFTQTMKKHFGERLAVFGPGYLPVPDKKEAITPYRYHIVVENNTEQRFWTEKLADAFLGYALPLYVGGPNVEDDFPPGSIVRIPPSHPAKAIQIIEEAMARDLWQERLAHIQKARNKILHEHNLFFRLKALLGDMPSPELLPPLSAPEVLPDFNAVRHRYHFREHLNHQAFKYLPIHKPLFPL